MSDLQHFTPILDNKDILHQHDDMAPYLMDWRGQFDGLRKACYFRDRQNKSLKLWPSLTNITS